MSEEGISVIYAAHLLKTKTIRIYDTEADEIYDKQLADKDFPNIWTNESIETYIPALLSLIPKKLDCLVLVNGGDCNVNLLHAAASAAPAGTLVRIIPALMARFLYVANTLDVVQEEKTKTLILLTKFASLTEFHTLHRSSNVYTFFDETPKFSPVNIPNGFAKYVSKYENGGTSVILFDEENAKSKDEIAQEYPGSNLIGMPCPQWHEMLISGGLFKASALMDPNPKDIIDVKDFTIGFNIAINKDEICLIEKGTAIPVKVNITKKLSNRVVVRSNITAIFASNILQNRKFVHERDSTKPEGLYNIEVEVDKNGIEKISVIKTSEAKAKAIEEKTVEDLPQQQPFKDLSVLMDSAAELPDINLINSVDDVDDSLILPKPADFMICLKDRFCCVCLPSNDKTSNVTTRTKNVNGNEWTPLYISFSHNPPSLGENAQADLDVDPEAVIYDILSFISQPFENIKINPEWAFSIAYDDNQNTVIECQTWKGPHAVYPVHLLALTFVALHKEAERVGGKSIKSVFVKKSGLLSLVDAKVITEAVKIARLECAGIEAMP